MTEKEIRSVLEDTCEELDRRSGERPRRGLFWPALLGAGLILTTAAACYGGPMPQPQPPPKQAAQTAVSVDK
jgi:hypothetical protein